MASKEPYMRWSVLCTLLLFALSAPRANAQTLEAWYRLDETTGSACADSASNGHDGVYDGCTLGQAGARPETGTSIRLNGSSDKVDIPDGPGFTTLRKELSAACWMNADQFGGVQRFFGNDGSWTWGVVNNSLRFTTRGVKDYDLSVGLSPSTWYHVAVVFDANFDVHFYLDGQPVGTVTGSAQANAPVPEWHIGYKDPGAPEWFGGFLDDIQVYADVLTDAQVQWLYDNPGQSLGAGPIGSNYCSPANLNSTGASAVITGWGQDTVLSNNLTLIASAMPANEVGYFLCGQTTGFVPNPGGSQGILCLSSTIGRFVAQAQSSGAGGEFSIAVDLNALPVWPNHAVQPGETWHFQAWFKDGASSNFTDGLSVTFL